MAINIRNKGAGAEREIATILNGIIFTVLKKLEFPNERINKFPFVERRQNQSASGGSDLCNTFGLSIEVKRQEALAINTWWKQCTTSAMQTNEHPVLIYRQNKTPWKVQTLVWLSLPNQRQYQVIATMSLESFTGWFENWVLTSIHDPD